MLIDWFTVGAQTLNFLILVWLMKRFLYHPILSAIDARETLIATELADADAKKSQAQQQQQEFERKNAAFDKQKAERLNVMNKEVQDEREHLLNDARHTADALASKRLASLQQDASTLGEALRQRTQDEVFGITRQTLVDLSGVMLEHRMTEVFNERLHNLDGDAKTELAKALRNAIKNNETNSAPSSTSPAIIRSAFELPQQQRDTIQNTLNETFSADIVVNFETAPNLVSGIELLANGQKLTWTIAGYLKTLEQGVSELLKSQVTNKSPDKPKGQ